MPSVEGWKFCPRCRSDLEIGEHRVECPACGFLTYASSSPTVSALCVDARGRVMLARRAGPPRAGLWDFPGGFLDVDEHPLDALRRELREEAGLEVEPEDFVGIWMDRYGEDDDAPATLNMYWTARIVGGVPKAADDVAELRWFSEDELPGPKEVAFENNAQALEAWRATRRR